MRSVRAFAAAAMVGAALCQVPATAFATPEPAPPVTDLWTVPTAPVGDFTLLIAYSFGNRMPAGADPARTEGEPGPVNEELAAAVVAARGDRDIPVYAQTVVADVLRSRYGMTDVVAIEADRNPDGTLTYLSTDGAAEKVATLRGSRRETDVAGVIAFGDHLWRATRTSVVNGFRAYAPAGVAMPAQYDPQSAQPWTRSQLAYLPVDYAGRLSLLR